MAQQEKKSQKLSYEQLEAYASQMETQARKIYEENRLMKQALNSKDMEYAFRVLDHAELFSKDFIKVVVKRLEELLNPERNSEVETKEEEKE